MNIRIKLIVAILLVVGLTLAEKYYTYSSKPSTSYTLDEEYNNSSITESTQKVETTGHICAECGNECTKNNEVHLIDSEMESYYLCGSSNCVASHNRKAAETRVKPQYSMGRDGRIYDKEPCSLCGGSGIEEVHNSLGDERRVCPMCHGKGHENY